MIHVKYPPESSDDLKLLVQHAVAKVAMAAMNGEVSGPSESRAFLTQAIWDALGSCPKTKIAFPVEESVLSGFYVAPVTSVQITIYDEHTKNCFSASWSFPL